MSKKATVSLIKELSADMPPLKKLAHPTLRTLPWIAIGAIYLFAVVQYLGLRHDAALKLQDTSFLFEVGIVAFISMSAALCSSWLCVPDMRGHRWINAVPLTLLGGFFILEVSRLITEGFFMPDIHWTHCQNDGLLLGVIPAASIMFLSKKGSTTQPFMMIAMNVLAVSSASYIGLRFTCSIDMVGHSFILHMLPFIVMGGIAGFAARALYKW